MTSSIDNLTSALSAVALDPQAPSGTQNFVTVYDRCGKNEFTGGDLVVEVLGTPDFHGVDNDALVLWKGPLSFGVMSQLRVVNVHNVLDDPGINCQGRCKTLDKLLFATHSSRADVKHSCISSFFDAMFQDLPAHRLNFRESLNGLGAKFLRSAIAADTIQCHWGFLKLESELLGVSTHIIPVPVQVGIGKYVRDMSGPALRLTLVVYELSEFLKTASHEGELGDVTCNLSWVSTSGCKEPCGVVTQPGKRYCSGCKCVVVAKGHEERCDPSPRTSSVGQRTNALLGDVLHRLDAVVGSHLKFYDGEVPGVSIARLVSGQAQAAWYRDNVSYGDDRSDSMLSRIFEADYLKHREFYLATEFDGVARECFPSHSSTALGSYAWTRLAGSALDTPVPAWKIVPVASATSAVLSGDRSDQPAEDVSLVAFGETSSGQAGAVEVVKRRRSLTIPGIPSPELPPSTDGMTTGQIEVVRSKFRDYIARLNYQLELEPEEQLRADLQLAVETAKVKLAGLGVLFRSKKKKSRS